MNEREYANRVIRLLEAGVRQIDVRVAGEIEARRKRALAGAGSPQAVGPGLLGLAHAHGGGLAAAIAAGLVTLALAAWWAGQQTDPSEDADMDLMLLTDDLPPNAYLDEEFPAWRRLPGLCRS